MYKKNVQWLLDGNPLTIDQVRNSNLASVRMRAALTMDINENKLSVKLTNNLIINKETNILGIGKLSLINDPQQSIKWLKVIKKHKDNGGKVFLDYTDNHLRETNKESELYKAYMEIINESDFVVTSSTYLENAINKTFNIQTLTIEDPLEVELISPKQIPQSTPTALWFGHASNLEYLFKYLQIEFKPSRKFNIIVMSNIYPFPEELFNNLKMSISPLIVLSILPWNIKNMSLAASKADFCIIPCGIYDERKKGASSNRLITSLALGLPCFADSLLSYEEFTEYFSPLDNESIESFLTNPSIFKDKTLASQTQITKRFSKEKIKNDWKNFFINII
jgi:hypothetical protein